MFYLRENIPLSSTANALNTEKSNCSLFRTLLRKGWANCSEQLPVCIHYSGLNKLSGGFKMKQLLTFLKMELI